jgi:hypothetical protein
MPGNAKKKCPKTAGNLVVQVQRQNKKKITKWDKLSQKCALELTPNVDSPNDKIYNRTTFKNLCPGSYNLQLTPQGEEALCGIIEKIDGSGSEQSIGAGTQQRNVQIEANKTRRLLYRFCPYELRVQVEEDRTGKKLPGITVEADGDPSLKAKRQTTDKQGLADFGVVRSGSSFNLKVILSQKDAAQYLVEAGYGPTSSKRLNEEPLKIKLARKKIYLQLHYADPEGASHPFPKDFAFSIVFDDGSRPTTPGSPKVLDDKGNFDFEMEVGKRWFMLQFESAKVRYLVHKKNPAGDKWIPDDTPMLEDPTDDALRQLTLDGKRFFSLPKKWSLATSQWDTERVTVPADGHIALPLNGCNSKDTAGKLTVKPKLLHVRFEYYDRQYGHSDHADKRISIPPIVLKGWHNDRFGSPPDHANPPADPDAASNWSLAGADPDKACKAQMLLWIATKKDDGSERKFDNKMLLSFGWPDGFVYSSSAKERKIEKIATGDAKRGLGVNRPKYYDLPQEWKSANYYTRLPGNTGKFFDELTEADIKAAFDPGKPLAFSLDDIVLIDSGGTQMDKTTMDKTDADADKALSADSRITLLDLDPAASFKVRVYEPRTAVGDKAPFWTKSDYSFCKDTAGAYRNVIVKYSQYARVIVFCSGFHDIYDKRTTDADFTKTQVLGARAAKLNDADVHVTERITANANEGDYASSWCGNFDLHFLQYGAVDADSAKKHKEMLFALVTYWSCRLKTGPNVVVSGVAKSVLPADVAKFREEGMKNAMDRWNVKDYEFHLTNRSDLRGKSFALFEAKLDSGGGTHICEATVVVDEREGGGSWMSLNQAHFRKSSYATEPARFGPATSDYDGTAYDCLAVAHELGHATGLKDAYVYYTEMDVAGGTWIDVPRYKQYYPGMPYLIDDNSIMYRNQAPRLRMYWGKVSWLHGKLTSLPGLTNADRFQVIYPGHKDLKYSRPFAETLKDLYDPAHDKSGFDWGAGSARCDLFLYRLGQDEFAHKITDGQTYNGILVVTTRIHVKFQGMWTAAQKETWVQTLNNTMNQGLNNRYRLPQKSGSGEFDNTLVRFFWQFAAHDPDQTVQRIPAPAQLVATGIGHHFQLTVTDSGDDWAADAMDGSKLTVGKSCETKKIIAYFLGISPSRFEGFSGWLRSLFCDDIGTGDFKGLSKWMQGETGSEFRMSKL